jgi:hypothetical protein
VTCKLTAGYPGLQKNSVQGLCLVSVGAPQGVIRPSPRYPHMHTPWATSLLGGVSSLELLLAVRRSASSATGMAHRQEMQVQTRGPDGGNLYRGGKGAGCTAFNPQGGRPAEAVGARPCETQYVERGLVVGRTARDVH